MFPQWKHHVHSVKLVNLRGVSTKKTIIVDKLL
jgi:hypothetical protein